jgi:hypothetical protein
LASIQIRLYEDSLSRIIFSAKKHCFQIKEMKTKENIMIPFPLIMKKVDIRFFNVKKNSVTKRQTNEGWSWLQQGVLSAPKGKRNGKRQVMQIIISYLRGIIFNQICRV